MLGTGSDNVAVNTGKIDVSAEGSNGKGGTIRMSAANVLLGGDGESIASLIADGASGGGNIELSNKDGALGGEGNDADIGSWNL